MTLNLLGPSPTLDTAADLVVAYIKKQIWLGELRPGDRLAPSDVGAAVGVSPTPVREAVATLAQQGRLIVRNHRGVFIGPFDAASLTDHYDLLGLVYSWAVERCAARLDGAERSRFGALADAMVEHEDPEGLYVVVKTVENAIYAAARSFSAENAARVLEGVVPGDIYSWVPEAAPLARTAMVEMVRTIARGEAPEAARQAREFFRAHGRLVIATLVRNGVIGDETGPTT